MLDSTTTHPAAEAVDRPLRRHAPGPDVLEILSRFTAWLERFGETSWDHQSFFAGPIGGRAKALYYRQKALGTAAVAPMILCEALLPSARQLFHHRIRFPIADAHYAMGFAYLHEATNDPSHLAKANHFLEELKLSRCAAFEEYCWGYPFDWVTRNGTISRQTPLITTTPYAFEAFLQVHELDGRRQGEVLRSIARHASRDIKDFRTSDTASSCSYSPFDGGGVINAAAYRGFLLTSASRVLGKPVYRQIADRNVNFVLDNQNPDGSWYYATDGVRDFVDHFHTCFVMKALAKVHSLTGDERVLAALSRGVGYYRANLFGEGGLPRPFARAPRLTVYKCELYDCAECINLCLLLRGRFPQLDETLRTVVAGIARDWVKPTVLFAHDDCTLVGTTCRCTVGRQSQMFRSLAFYHREQKRSQPATKPGPSLTH